MKKLLLIFLSMVAFESYAQKNITSIQDRTKLNATVIDSSIDHLILLDSLQFGMLIRCDKRTVSDGGVVLQDAAGNKFKRQFVSSDGVNPFWWGARGDGINDDLPALIAAANYCNQYPASATNYLRIPNGVFRITDTWVLGAKFLEDSDITRTSFTVGGVPSFKVSTYRNAMVVNPLRIVGSGKTVIYADFDAQRIKSVIYYALMGDRRTNESNEMYTGEISNLGVYAKGSYINGKPYALKEGFWGANQIGIVAINNVNLKIEKVTVYGFKNGIIANNSYFGQTSNVLFKSCDVGYFSVQSHGSIIENTVAYFCNTSYDIYSGQMLLNNVNSEHSKAGIRMHSGSNVINGSYLESNRHAGEGQLIIGDSAGSSIAGISVNAITIAASNEDGSIGIGLVLKKTASVVSINGGSIQSVGIRRDNPATELLLTGVTIDAPEWAFIRNADITARNVGVANNLNVKGAATVGSLQVNSDLKVNNNISAGNLNLGGIYLQKSTINNASIQSKNISGLPGSTDYILPLGKYSVADNTKINGVLSILGNSAYTACGIINIAYSNGATGYAKSFFELATDTKYLAIDIITYSLKGSDERWAGIRFLSNSTTAWLPVQFLFQGLISDNPVIFKAIATNLVSNIQPLTPTDSRLEIITNDLTIPHLKSTEHGVKKTLKIDEFGRVTAE